MSGEKSRSVGQIITNLVNRRGYRFGSIFIKLAQFDYIGKIYVTLDYRSGQQAGQ